MKLKLFFMVVAMAFLAGCSTPRMNTTSGAPEVIIHGDIDTIKTAFVNHLVDKGWTPISDSAFGMLFEHEGTFTEDMFFGSTWNSHTRERLRLTTIKQTDGVRVVSHHFLVTNPGSGYERMNEISGQRDQYGLDCIAADIEGNPRPQEPPREPPVTSPHGK